MDILFSWKPFLIQSGFLEGELENNKNHGEEHLVYWVDNGKTKIYVLKWVKYLMNFLNDMNFC